MPKLINQLLKGTWSNSQNYTIGDIVVSEGSSYICILAHTDHQPPSATYWALLAQKGTDGIDGAVTLSTAQTLTNKSIDGNNNTLTNIGTAAIEDANITSRKIKQDKIQVATSSSDITTTSASLVDLTGATVTFTPDVASNAEVTFSAQTDVSGGGAVVYQVLVDGVAQSIPTTNAWTTQAATQQGSLILWITGLTVASHTIKIQWSTSAGTAHTRSFSLIVKPYAS